MSPRIDVAAPAVTQETAQQARARGRLILCMAIACGILVANLYFGQPLAGPISASLGLAPATAGIAVTLTQAGYAAGLLLLVPLGDLVETRALVVSSIALGAVALAAGAVITSALPFFVASFAIGVCSVSAQILVPYAAHIAHEHERGHVVGRVMSGLLLGIMLSRPVASFVTSLLGWHAVYGLSAALMAVLAIVLAYVLPRRKPESALRYHKLLVSLGAIWMSHPILRYRALIHAGLLAAFIYFWTAVPLYLIAHFHFTQRGIALFALAGVSGALVAPRIGRIADAAQGRPRLARTAQLAAITASIVPFILSLAGRGPLAIAALVAAAILLDAAVTANMILSQRAIFSLGDDIRTRINALYMTTIFSAAAAGSTLAAWSLARSGWHLTALIGAALPTASLTYAVIRDPGRVRATEPAYRT